MKTIDQNRRDNTSHTRGTLSESLRQTGKELLPVRQYLKIKKIFCDWGTSNLRAYLLEEGQVTKRYNSDQGLLKARESGFEKVMQKVFVELDCPQSTPVYLSGMIGSRQGWKEADYKACPVDAESFRGNEVSPEGFPNIKILGGVSYRDEALNIDLMRGEEVQVFGLLKLYPHAKVICLPGSHSKWVKIDAGKIKSFTTYMTGELFKCFSEHTIFKQQIDSDDFDLDSFIQGIEFSREHLDLSSSLFKLRTEYLFERMDTKYFHCYLSGFLIGSEMREAAGTTCEVQLCGSDELMALYAIAAERFGIKTQVVKVEEATIRGIESILEEAYV